MKLPREIRLEIYRYLYLMTPISRRFGFFLPAADTSPFWTPYFRWLRLRDDDISESVMEYDTRNPFGDDTRPVKRSEPHASLPTALLCTCKAIYYESREIPFKANRYNFLIARGPTRAVANDNRGILKAWQIEAIRHIRVNIMTLADIRWFGQYPVHQWDLLCGILAKGLQSLHLMAKLRTVDKDLSITSGPIRQWTLGQLIPGLCQLEHLQCLEIAFTGIYHLLTVFANRTLIQRGYIGVER